MPEPMDDVLISSGGNGVEFCAEPVFSSVVSLHLLCKYDRVGGFDDWVGATYRDMTEEQRSTNCLVVTGFYHAIMPLRSWDDMPSYLAHLKAADPTVLRNRLMEEYSALAWQDNAAATVDKNAALLNPDNYLAFLTGRFGDDHVDEQLERRAFEFVVDPPKLKELLVSHLETMWDRYLRPEEARLGPIIDEELARVRRMALPLHDRMAIITALTGEDLRAKKKHDALDAVRHVRFVPHPHLGHYVRLFFHGDRAWVFYGPRIAGGVDLQSPLLSRREMMTRMSALADETRLEVARLIASAGELKSQEVQEQLGLSQSATSRHLTQLAAAGYLQVERDGGSKRYRIDQKGVQSASDALRRFLLGT